MGTVTGTDVIIDRDNGSFSVGVAYDYEIYTDPESGEDYFDADWYLSYTDSDGFVWDYSGYDYGGSGYAYGQYFALDTKPGVYVGTLSFEAYAYVDTVAKDFNVYDGALERSSLTISGSLQADIVFGGFSSDTIRTNAGNDWLDGGSGTDQLYGGTDNDTYVVSGSDKVYERSGEGTDLVLASTSYALLAGQEIERFETTDEFATSAIKLFGNDRSQTITGNYGSNVLEGRDGNDTLRGLNGGDTLRGGNGNDTLAGGLNSDTLTGGAGADTFLFDTSLKGNVDHITDFKAVDDTIRLENDIFAKLTKTGTLASTAFKDIGIADAKVDADDRIIYDHNSGRLWYDADGSGSTAKVQFAILDTHPTITAQDFLVV